MKCPKCGQARPLSDQICRRCKYVFDEDRFLELTLPRAASAPAPKKFFTGGPEIGFAQLFSRPWVPPVASLIPGLGHYVQGKRWLGMLYFFLVLLLIALSVVFFSNTYGQMIFGLAVSTHATCILDTTPWGRSPEAKPRILGMAVILSGLMVLYWPLVERLARFMVTSQRRYTERDSWGPPRALGLEQLAVMLVLFALSTAVSTWFSRRLSSREP